jgi:uncharacterized membrane protein
MSMAEPSSRRSLIVGRAARFARSRSGNLATLTALTMPVALVLAAFAVDAGALYVEKRKMQSLADLAAIAAAANIKEARKAAAMVLRDNGFRGSGSEAVEDELLRRPDGSGCGLTVTRGIYSADPLLAPGDRFTPDEKSPNAARVSLCNLGTRYFSAGFFDAPFVGAKAIAATRDEATFSVGSRLARLDGGIANAVLGGLTGSSISLTAMDYEALLSADFRLLSFLDALDGNLALEAASYNDVLTADITLGEMTSALAQTEGLSAAAKLAAGRLVARFSGNGGRISLSRLIDLGSLALLPVGAAPWAGNDPHVGGWELISAAAGLSAANGRRQVELDLGANAAGLASAKLALAIGEPPQSGSWFGGGGEGAIVRTAQTRLLLEVAVGGSGILAGASVKLPIYLELAHAEAKLARIDCPSTPGGKPAVVVAARPGIARLQIAEMDKAALTRFDRSPATAPARLVSTAVARVSGRADIEIANRNDTRLRFSGDDIEKRIVKRVSTTQIAGSLTRSLLEDIRIEAEVAGLGLVSPQSLGRLVADLLGTATPAIDTLLTNLLATLGISVGEADVRVHSATCGSAVLVQ